MDYKRLSQKLSEALDEPKKDKRSLLPLIKTTLNHIRGLIIVDAWQDEDDPYKITIPMASGGIISDIKEKVIRRLKSSKLSGSCQQVDNLLILNIKH